MNFAGKQDSPTKSKRMPEQGMPKLRRSPGAVVLGYAVVLETPHFPNEPIAFLSVPLAKKKFGFVWANPPKK